MFISSRALWRTACRFLVAEMGPNVDPFMLHIYASLAEKETRASSVSGPRPPCRLPSAKGRKLGTAG